MANGIVHFRRLSEFLFGIKYDQGFLYSFDGPFDAIIKIQGIVYILDIDSFYPVNRQRTIYTRTIFLFENGTFYETNVSRDLIFDLSNEWDSFRRLQVKTSS